MGDATIFGAKNHGLNSANTWTAGETVTGLGVASLADARLSKPIRFLYATEASTWIRLAITSGQYREVGGVCIAKSNLWRSATRDADTGAVTGVAQWRVRASQTNFQVRVRPDAIATSTNLTGTVAALQDLDPEQPNATWLTATAAGSATAVRATFPTLGGLNLKTGAGLQTFRFRVRRTTAGSGTPTLTVELYESGSLKATLTASKSSGFVTDSIGELVTASWNASDLTTVTGANLEIRLSGTGTGGSSLEFKAVEQKSDFDFTGTHDYDSGLLTIALPNTLGELPCNLYRLTTSTIRPNYVQVDFFDSTNPDGYVQLGLPVIGPRITFGVNNVTPGAEWSLRDGSLTEITYGGAKKSDPRPKRRAFHGTWENLSDAEGIEAVLDKLGFNLGLTGCFVFVFDPDTPARYPHTAAYARFTAEPRILYPYDDGRTWQIDMEEEVA